MSSRNFYHWLFWPLLLLVLATLIFVCTKIQFIFKPFLTFISVVFVPLILSGFLYYMLNPILKLMMKIKVGRFHFNKGVASLLLVALLILVVAGGLTVLIPPVVKEITSLVTHLPQTATGLQHLLNNTVQHSPFKNVDINSYYRQFDHQLAKYAQVVLKGLSSRVGEIGRAHV